MAKLIKNEHGQIVEVSDAQYADFERTKYKFTDASAAEQKAYEKDTGAKIAEDPTEDNPVVAASNAVAGKPSGSTQGRRVATAAAGSTDAEKAEAAKGAAANSIKANENEDTVEEKEAAKQAAAAKDVAVKPNAGTRAEAAKAAAAAETK